MVASANQVATAHSAQMRYAGQSYEIEVPLSKDVTTASQLRDLFSQKHRDVYGYELNSTWECVAIRTTITEKRRSSVSAQANMSSCAKRSVTATKAFFPSCGWRDVPELERHVDMRSVSGPAIITDEFSTIVVPPEWNASSKDGGHIHIEFAGN